MRWNEPILVNSRFSSGISQLERRLTGLITDAGIGGPFMK